MRGPVKKPLPQGQFGRGTVNEATRRSVLEMAGAALAMTISGCSAGIQRLPLARSQRIKQSARDRLEQAFSRIVDPTGEGARAYLTLYRTSARAAADAADGRARTGATLGPLDGVLVSIKDLFNVVGESTRAGSKMLVDAAPALADATVVQRLRAAGAVIVGKTNMSEFAFSGVGTNSHYGTPGNPADRLRVPGGSTSGGAVALADAMCEIAIGTDTGGSTRIPAALCGLVGYKPTKYRVPTTGAFPLSPTLDSVGPMAMSVQARANADAVMAGAPPSIVEPASLQGLRLSVPQGLPLSDLDGTVSARFGEAIEQLGRAGVRISEGQFPILEDMIRVNSNAPLAVVESYPIHRERLATRAAEYDPFVRLRIERGRTISAAHYAKMLDDRNRLVQAMDARMSQFDALVLPTTPIVAPTIVEVSTIEGFNAKNRLLLRNTAIANFFDLCAISLPVPRAGGLPAGLMLIARRGQDRVLFKMASAVERILSGASL